MDKKFVKISALVLAGLVLLILWPKLNAQLPDLKKRDQEAKLSVNLAGFTRDKVNRLIIKKDSEEKILGLKDGRWFVDEEEAEPAKIEELFKAFSELKIKEMVSQKEENFSKFEVARDKGFELTIFQKDREDKFFIGKTGRGLNDFYLRKEGIKNVYLVNGKLRSILLQKKDEWKKSAKTDEENKK